MLLHPGSGIAVLIFVVLSSACTSPSHLAPVRGETPQVARGSAVRPALLHIVKPDETLYSIAWRSGNDFRDIARWNGIRPPYTIYPGQRLHLARPAGYRAPAGQKRPRKTSAKTVTADKQSDKAVTKRHNKPSPAVRFRPGDWRWPAAGRLVGSFGRSGKKGINIAGEFRQPVRSAAAGKVVYSGGGLIGYGKLIIIKHNDSYLSAYGHNNKLLVAEGDTVKPGEAIARMGKVNDKQALLHFEIRHNGKPVDPLRYLPKRRRN